MLTYQLQRRLYKIKNAKPFSFPSDVEVEVCLEPSEQFGVGNRPGRTAVQAHKASGVYDANTGRGKILSDPPLQPIQAGILWEPQNLQYNLDGNILHGKVVCETFEDLELLMVTVHYAVPILLNLEFAEPPVVKYTRGKVGDAIFNWELEETRMGFDITTEERQERKVMDSFRAMETFAGNKNRRLMAALYYFYVTRRLVEAGNSPYEFLSEVVLNLCKVLEVLFSNKRDYVRAELLNFGYSKEEIEEKFIPIMIVRNEFDVGHVSIALFTQEQLDALYRYLEESEFDFRDLLKKVLSKVIDGSYSLQQDPDLKLDTDKLKIMMDLIRTFEQRAKQAEQEGRKGDKSNY